MQKKKNCRINASSIKKHRKTTANANSFMFSNKTLTCISFNSSSPFHSILPSCRCLTHIQQLLKAHFTYGILFYSVLFMCLCVERCLSFIEIFMDLDVDALKLGHKKKKKKNNKKKWKSRTKN